MFDDGLNQKVGVQPSLEEVRRRFFSARLATERILKLDTGWICEIMCSRELPQGKKSTVSGNISGSADSIN